MKRTLGVYAAWLVATVMLVLAVTAKYPYGFYMLLRWICCAVFVYSAFRAQEENRVGWVWIFGVLAVLFNPIVPLHFQRDTWQIVDWGTIGVIVVAGVAFWPPGVFNQFHFKISSTQNNALYDDVARELQAKTMVPGLWTKAFAEARGQMDQARALYIKYRVAQLAYEASEQLRQEHRATRETARQQAARQRVEQRAATEAARQRAMLGWRNFAYGVLAAVLGLLTLISGLLTIFFGLAGLGATLGQAGQPVALIIISFATAAVFGFLTVLCGRLTWKCFKAVKSVQPPSRPANAQGAG